MSVEPYEGVDIAVSLFEIPSTENTKEALQEREEEYELVLTEYIDDKGRTGKVGRGSVLG